MGAMTGKGAHKLTNRRSGDGWAQGPNGTRVWGLYGSAGLFLVALKPQPHVLLQHRADWTSMGNTWGIPGGAIDAEENAIQGALRETQEECGIDPSAPQVDGAVVTTGPFPGDNWTYTTVFAHTDEQLATQANEESYELRWVAVEKLQEQNLASLGLELMPPFKETLPAVLAVAQELIPGLSL